MSVQSVGDFFITLAFIGAVTGFVGGVAAAWRGWPALRAFAVLAAAVFAISFALDLYGGLGARELTLALIGSPLVGLFPAGAGFVIARRLVRRP